MKEKVIQSRKKLKDLPHMTFVRREIAGKDCDTPKSVFDCKRSEIRDYFRHQEANITLVRILSRYKLSDDKIHGYVFWECPDLGSGNASIGYWLRKAKTRTKR